MTLLPGVHNVSSLAKRWLLGTHQGSIDEAHLADYLDESCSVSTAAARAAAAWSSTACSSCRPQPGALPRAHLQPQARQTASPAARTAWSFLPASSDPACAGLGVAHSATPPKWRYPGQKTFQLKVLLVIRRQLDPPIGLAGRHRHHAAPLRKQVLQHRLRPWRDRRAARDHGFRCPFLRSLAARRSPLAARRSPLAARRRPAPRSPRTECPRRSRRQPPGRGPPARPCP